MAPSSQSVEPPQFPGRFSKGKQHAAQESGQDVGFPLFRARDSRHDGLVKPVEGEIAENRGKENGQLFRVGYSYRTSPIRDAKLKFRNQDVLRDVQSNEEAQEHSPARELPHRVEFAHGCIRLWLSILVARYSLLWRNCQAKRPAHLTPCIDSF